MKELVGKTILAIYLSADGEEAIAFETNEGTIVYDAEGDCCSESWFSDLLGVSALIGGTVTSADNVQETHGDPDDGRGRQEEDEIYCVKITTDRGICDVQFRNSSNGYYGGSYSLCREVPESLAGWKKIEADYP